MKILKVNAVTVGLEMSYFMATSGKPGAMMELANGETKLYNDIWHGTKTLDSCYSFTYTS